ncbi:hypothetical protein ACGFK1_31535 [Mycobacterium sp. NPDC048908]|uniref:hypothetical protein n=1 Tax=Mycobacterium sp. NPDC048908 TaxID=3364292 RepID=UPI00371791CB
MGTERNGAAATTTASAVEPQHGSSPGTGVAGTQPPDDPRRTDLRVIDSGFTAIVALTIAAGVGVPLVALASGGARGWFGHHIAWLLVGYGNLLAVLLFAGMAWWSRHRSGAVRVASLLLVGSPAILTALGGFVYVAEPTWRVNVIRALLDVILLITPAVMWWLFIEAQRASLLNEFLTNVQRLGLLERRDSLGENEAARATRIDSYLQKFEGTYGRVPRRVHSDVLKDRITPYSTEEARSQAPYSVSTVPVSLTVIVLAIGWLVTLPPSRDRIVDDHEVWKTALTPTAAPVTFAFLGAYFFAIQMLFRRYVRSDLRGSAYVAVVMRILIALIGIWVITAVAQLTPWANNQSALLLIGFVVGVFPVVAWQIIRNLMVKMFRFALPSLQPEMALDCLDGLTVWHEARLEEEDIENVPDMATADIVSLLISTRFPADRIIDWVDEAILLTYLGPNQVRKSERSSARELLARHGIRTASALLSSARSATDHGRIAEFSHIVVDDAGRSVLPSLITSVRTNSNLDLVLRWRGQTA